MKVISLTCLSCYWRAGKRSDSLLIFLSGCLASLHALWGKFFNVHFQELKYAIQLLVKMLSSRHAPYRRYNPDLNGNRNIGMGKARDLNLDGDRHGQTDLQTAITNTISTAMPRRLWERMAIMVWFLISVRPVTPFYSWNAKHGHSIIHSNWPINFCI